MIWQRSEYAKGAFRCKRIPLLQELAVQGIHATDVFSPSCNQQQLYFTPVFIYLVFINWTRCQLMCCVTVTQPLFIFLCCGTNQGELALIGKCVSLCWGCVIGSW